ncbi:Cfr10I/Bse634I family restriction endonuclease [Vibrio breoganii]|uniref:Cfr10I/Bse634I family restriction endonuclease n=1 Tax=Vibrio breoganii TaxID=553239 RepID=UPI000CC5F9C3|nr:Cfr10I/Bse634I family restriction endonuclease [Vibrio breoganii]PMF72629.1 hypothetical protein BCV08_17970 [Vibrio breoganii]PMH16622.1 hypothetical protein BCU74_01310 [Vibrio breoganii]PMM16206.1 hypothetical protein BCT60_00505 [Vibrio breoganii]
MLRNLPNIRRFDSGSLYLPEIFEFVRDLRSKLESSLDIQMITSYPDYVIINTNSLGGNFKREKIAEVSKKSLQTLDSLYGNIVNS